MSLSTLVALLLSSHLSSPFLIFLILASLLFNLSQESRELRYNTIKSMLEENIKLRDKSETKFQAFFEREVNKLRNDFRVEAEVRSPFHSPCCYRPSCMPRATSFIANL